MAGNGKERTIEFTREYLDSIFLEERLIDSRTPDLKMELFGETFDSPIMMAAFSHLKASAGEGKNGMCEYSRAMKEMNQVNWVGMCENEEFEEIMETGARTIRIIKPYKDRDKIYSQIECAKKCHALAVGMDIDHIFQEGGKYDCCMGEDMTRQSLEDIKGYVEAAKIPFVIKGVLSVQDAVKCAEAGVKGIVVSHHHGRMPFALPPVMVLPDILKALGEHREMKVFADCSVDSGVDAFKLLAMGADAVSAGRVLLPYLKKDGCEGIREKMQKMNEELAEVMAYTGCISMEKMDRSVLHLTSI